MLNLRQDIESLFASLSGIPEHFRFPGRQTSLGDGYLHGRMGLHLPSKREWNKVLRLDKKKRKAHAKEWQARKKHSKKLREQARLEFVAMKYGP